MQLLYKLGMEKVEGGEVRSRIEREGNVMAKVIVKEKGKLMGKVIVMVKGKVMGEVMVKEKGFVEKSRRLIPSGNPFHLENYKWMWDYCPGFTPKDLGRG